jgi:hypothetical protein
MWCDLLLANSINQIARNHEEKKEYDSALKLFLQSFQIFSKIGSPNAETVKRNIARIRKR